MPQFPYVSVSQARLIQTQLKLASLKKGADSISMYFCRAKTLDDTLAATGRSLPHAEFIPYLLARLGHLLAHEARMLHHSNTNIFSTDASANFTAKQQSTQHSRGSRWGRNNF